MKKDLFICFGMYYICPEIKRNQRQVGALELELLFFV